MAFFIRSESDFSESNWSGGSTKQLYIFPEDASYADRNFQIRISTAKVEVSESTFTSLPGFSRKLMILEGEIEVNHKNHYSKKLKPFEVDSFSGDWTTTALGTCIDFNVMTAGVIKSELSSVEVLVNESVQISGEESWSELFLFPLDGSLTIAIDQQTIQMEKGNLFCVKELGNQTVELSAENIVRVVVVRVKQ